MRIGRNPMAACAVRLASAAALCLRLFAPPTTVVAAPATQPPVRTAIGEYVMLVDLPTVSVYTPLDPDGGALLFSDARAAPFDAACAHFNRSVYCVGEYGPEAWRFDRVSGSPLPLGPDLNRTIRWPGNGHLANVNDEWLVTCGDSYPDLPNTCQVLHVNASHWVEIESEACGTWSAAAEHNGSVFVAGGRCMRYSRHARRSATAAVRSLRISRTPSGDDTFRWQRHPDMNASRGELAIASHNGYLYACGGYEQEVNARTRLADCERWREGMDSWQGIVPLPQPRHRLHLLSVDGHLIAMGGKDNDSLSEYSLDVFDYNEAEDTWSRLHDMPYKPRVANRINFGSAVVPAV